MENISNRWNVHGGSSCSTAFSRSTCPQERGSAVGASAETSGPELGRSGARVGGDTGPARQAIPKPQPRPLRARKEAAAEEGAAGVPRARLTCRTHGRAFILREQACRGGRGFAHPSCPPPTRALPRSGRRQPAPPGAGAQGHRGPSTSGPALLLTLLLPRAGPGPGAWRLAHTPKSRTPSPRGRRLRGGRGAARLQGPGARVAPEPPAPHGDSQSSAPRPDSAGSARRAGGRGCWRASSASARAPAGEGPACAPRSAAAATAAGTGGRGPAAPRRARRLRPATLNPRGGCPEFSSPRRRRLFLPPAARSLWMLRGSPEPLPAGSGA